MPFYRYDGPVVSISGRCTTHNWSAETHADSKEKAQSNIKYQYKRDHGLVQKNKIYLPNEVVEIP